MNGDIYIVVCLPKRQPVRRLLNQDDVRYNRTMELSSQELAQMKRNLTRKAAERSRALQERLSEARGDLDRIVRHIA